MSVALRVALNTSSQVLGKVFSGTVTFIISLILARMYGPSGYGDFTKITTFVGIFYLLTDFGMNAVYLRDKSHGDDSRWFPMLLTLRIFLSCLYSFLIAAMLVFLPTGTDSGYTQLVKFGILITVPTVLLQSILVSANAVFQERLRYDLSLLASVIGSTVTLLLILIGSQIFVPRVAFLSSIGSITVGALVAAASAVLFVRQFTSIRLGWDWSMLRALFVSSIPLGVTLLFNVIYFRADSIILTVTRPTAEVGIYGLAYKIFEFPLALPTFFMNAIYPVLLVRLRGGMNDGTGNVWKFIRKALLILLISSISFTLILWFAAPLLVLIRSDFSGSIQPLRILLLGLPFFFLSSLTMWLLIALRRHLELLLIYGIGMIANILANLRFTPGAGAFAASWITVLSEVYVCLASAAILIPFIKRIARTDKEIPS
jgi:O-antigen/teichoic acid export membrane protein